MISYANPSQPHLPPPLLTGMVLLSALLAGRLIAGGSVALGVAVAFAAIYLFVVFVDIGLAIAGWAIVLFVASLTVVSVGPTAIGLLLILAWVGAGGLRRRRLPVLRSHRALIVTLVVFVCWLTLSTTWATRQARALDEAFTWWTAVLALVLVATSLSTPRNVVYVALAFVAGAVLAVGLGFLGLGGSASLASDVGRFEPAGDPNYQAAALLAAMCMAGGLMSVFRRLSARVALLSALVFITLGFFATESRGGLVALTVAMAAALAIFRRQRAQIVSLAIVGSAAAAVWLYSRPDSFDRLTTFGGGGSGREDIWSVAWRVFEDHPLVGVGLGNFQDVEARYVLEPGGLTHVAYISETPKAVHNSYLGLLVETGVVGLIGFALVAVLAVRASWRAAREFDAKGAVGLGNLARAVLVATIGMLAGLFFLSNPYDHRLWILFALGLVLHTIASRSSAPG